MTPPGFPCTSHSRELSVASGPQTISVPLHLARGNAGCNTELLLLLSTIWNDADEQSGIVNWHLRIRELALLTAISMKEDLSFQEPST
eukprot:CAMPEP_0180563802 /NCGR_PEP_ID=MMETSP1037_2-20121125/4672_1 /TAXON_ID=632150 /ORGANISM="Azadinium spinosum, Strain 3D9" /LENGTH=87 /DNA_ID=CAMNT_0022580661 /DNA_START=107 /DNA_END=370 /DNA_ORIENTATION=+